MGHLPLAFSLVGRNAGEIRVGTHDRHRFRPLPNGALRPSAMTNSAVFRRKSKLLRLQLKSDGQVQAAERAHADFRVSDKPRIVDQEVFISSDA
jgi:hypothetical protein